MAHMQQMLVATGYKVTLSGGAVEDTNPAGASAILTFNSDGTVEITTTIAGTLQIFSSTDWIRPQTHAPGSFVVNAELDSGTLSSGTTGSDQALTSDRSWQCSASAGNREQASLTIAVKLGAVTLGSATYTLDANAL